MNEQITAITADLEELQSRGFGHQDAPQIVGRMRVALQQLADQAGAPAPEPEPVDVQLGRLADAVEGLQLAMHAAIDGAAAK